VGDAELTCEQIAVDYKTNTEVAANKKRRQCFLDRNIHLRELAKAKGCKGMEFWPAQPERYTYRWANRSDIV
jgi:hypothetical protein